MESRVKSWESIEEKLERKSLELTDIASLDDLVGIRLILLFRADLTAVDALVQETFDVLRSEDTSKRLGEAQFGYQSQHYILQLPKSWFAIPTLADLDRLKVELQVRTLAQHIWAAASHKLQYKHEDSVPPPLRRTINRVSALLETVDLEFDRVLNERREYQSTGISSTEDSEPLNVDLLASILSNTFPAENKKEDEPYEELIGDLNNLSINTLSDLKSILKKHTGKVMKKEKILVAKRAAAKNYSGTTEDRIKRGVFYAHAGLTRNVLREEFGEKAEKIFRARVASKSSGKASN